MALGVQDDLSDAAMQIAAGSMCQGDVKRPAEIVKRLGRFSRRAIDHAEKSDGSYHCNVR